MTVRGKSQQDLGKRISLTERVCHRDRPAIIVAIWPYSYRDEYPVAIAGVVRANDELGDRVCGGNRG